MKHVKGIRNAYFTPMIRPVVVIYFRVVNQNPRRIVPSTLWPVQFVSFHIQNVEEVWKFSYILKNLQLWLNGKRIFSNITQLNCVTLPNGQGSFMTQLLETMISISGIVMGTVSIVKNAMPSYSTDTKQSATLEIWQPKNVYFLRDHQRSRNYSFLVAVSSKFPDKFVKLCLHSNWTVQNYFQFDKIFFHEKSHEKIRETLLTF